MRDWLFNSMYWLNQSYGLLLSVPLFTLMLLGVDIRQNDPEVGLGKLFLIKIRQLLVFFLISIILIIPLAVWIGLLIAYWDASTATNAMLAWMKAMAVQHWQWIVGTLLLGLTSRISVRRYVIPKWSNIKKYFRVNVSQDTPSDIRTEKQRFEAFAFKPEEFYKLDTVFFGLDEKQKQVSIPIPIWRETNKQLIGPTRFGKGVMLGNFIAQSIMRGDSVIYIDPKADKFLPHIMADYAEKYQRDFIYCDLNDDGVGGWHPFLGGDQRARRARLMMAFGLEDTGKESDFYKVKERKIIDQVIIPHGLKINGMKQLFEQESHKELLENAQRAYSHISEWAEIKSLCPKGAGLSFEKSLINNAVIYIKGSLDDEVVCNATRVMIMEIIQEARRLKNQRTSHLSLYIDEVSFLVSRVLVDALATVVGFDTDITLAYQSKTDLRKLKDKNLDPFAVEKSVDTNCQIKFLYGSQDIDTCEWAEKMSGTLQKHITRMEATDIGGLGEETWRGQRFISLLEESHVTHNMMLSLKPRVGVLFQPSQLAQTVYTHWLESTCSHQFDKQHYIKSVKI